MVPQSIPTYLTYSNQTQTKNSFEIDKQEKLGSSQVLPDTLSFGLYQTYGRNIKSTEQYFPAVLFQIGFLEMKLTSDEFF